MKEERRTAQKAFLDVILTRYHWKVPKQNENSAPYHHWRHLKKKNKKKKYRGNRLTFCSNNVITISLRALCNITYISLCSAGLQCDLSPFRLFSPSFEWRVSVTSLLVSCSPEEHTYSDKHRPPHSDISHTLWAVNNISGPCWLIAVQSSIS